MGLSDEIKGALINAGGSAITGAFAPSPFQPRQSFKGTPSDPVKGLGEIQAMLRGLLSGQLAKVELGPDMPGSHVGAGLPSFSGGGLPMPIGVPGTAASGHGDLLKGIVSGQNNHVDLDLTKGPNQTPGAPTEPVQLPGTGGGGGDNGGEPTSHAYGPGLNLAPVMRGGANPQLTQIGIDDQTQGALQLLFHSMASGTRQPIKQPLGVV